MDSHYRGQLYRFENLFHIGACLKEPRITHIHSSSPVLERVATKTVQRGWIDRNVDHRGFATIKRGPHGLADLPYAFHLEARSASTHAML